MNNKNKAALWLKHCSFLSFLIPALFLLNGAAGQSNLNEGQGLKPYDTLHGGDLDSVSVTSGGLALHIPLDSFPQRGNLDLSFMVTFSNKQWYIKPPRISLTTGKPIGTAQWQPMPNTGVQVVSSTDWWLNTCTTIEPQDPNIQGQTLYDWSDSVSSPDGSTHIFGDQVAAFSGPIFPMHSLDASGLLRPDLQTLILPNGTRYSYPTASTCSSPFGRIRGGKQAGSVTDANGNQITISSSGWTDSMGRFIPGSANSAVQGIQPGVPTSDLSRCPAGTSSALIWNVPGVANVNAGVRTFYFCYSIFTLSTNFDSTTSQGATNYGPVSTPLLSAVVMPDLTMWTFAYDNYGDVLRVGFPTGGSLSYTYGIGPLNSGTGTGFSTWVMSRIVDANDGTGGHQWKYNYQGGFPTGAGSAIYLYAVKGVATVTSPDGNDVVHSIGPGGSGSGCPGFVYQTQSFQGSASSGTLFKTIQTQYACTMGTPGGNLDGNSLNAVPTQVTTVWPGGQTAKVVKAYDPTFNDPQGQPVRIGSVLQADEYDFSNTLARSTVNQYLWQSTSSYLNNNFVTLITSTTVKNGAGQQLDQTLSSYDQSSLASSGVGAPTHVAPPAGEPFRGNRTTTSHRLDSTNSFLSTTATYFDTGMLATSTPPPNADGLNRTTTYMYSSTFLGAYHTQTNMPSTQMPDSGAPVVQHVISGNYDFNTGLLAGFTDENNQSYSYQYDSMLRLTQANHPDGGQTLFNYPDPNTVERQRLISSGTYDSFTAKFDGLGRSYETLQVTPSGTIEVDTVFDSLSRVSTVSNPYYQGSSHGSDPTYGVTQSQYDALSRVIKTIKQDGSASTWQYNTPAGDGAGSSVACTTTADEAGKLRQVCSDGLGRMVKVVEPNPGSTAVNAAGWVAVTGSEQSATSQPATSGTGSVTISGSEQCFTPPPPPTCQPPMPCCLVMPEPDWTYLDPPAELALQNICDHGTVSITVNGHPDNYLYSSTDTPNTIAAGLASVINSDSGAYVTASASGATVYLTAKGTGASTNYSLSANSSTSDPSDFGGSSFSASPSGTALGGGQNASSVADSGTITVTVNGNGYATTFGASDTASTIAGRLAGIINNGSYAGASASGSRINLTSKTGGSAADYTLSASYIWNSGQFTNPSFTTSISGPALSGGKNAGDLNNNPYVTTYQYNARGDLLCVHQKGTDTTADVACTGTTAPSVPAAWRQRFFTYDSFSRLLTAQNPETSNGGGAQITYAYDAEGNVTSKTEPAPNQTWGSSPVQIVTIGHTYDALNRLLNTTYSDGVTPNTAHRYDYASFLGHTFAYPIGREVAATSANNTITSFTSYDKAGRVAQTAQCTPGVSTCQTFTANYGPMGQLLSLGYPGSGFTVTYSYDSAARLTTASDSNGVTYAQSPTYLASGVIQEFSAPNFANNKYHVNFNSRLQPTEMWAGSAQGSGALFDKQYTYNAPNTSQMNNGNIYAVTNVVDSTRTQTFTYDALNRLTSAGDQTHWYNTYTYDAWGNLTQKTRGALPYGENLSTSANASNELLGYAYDAAGNMTTDGVNSWTYVYDAENRIITAGPVTYTYDADGRRVKKSSGTNYWYGPGNGVLAETDSSGNWTNYVFFGGQRLARNVSGDIKYYITDHLHSTAMFVDKAGTTAAVLDDNDFYPWGGVIPGVGKTTSNNTIKITNQYRDTESQLDYFGARYYANVTGRFMTPDWSAKPTSVPYAEFGDPQSLNLYSYARNGPTIHVDPDGHFLDDCTVCNHGDSGFSVAPDVDRLGPQWVSTTITFTDGTTQTLIHPKEGSLTAEDITSGNFIRVGERPLLPGPPADHWYHTYVEIPVVKDGVWTGEYETYGVLGNPGSSANQQVRANDSRNGDKPGSDRNYHYIVPVTPAQREALRSGSSYWTQHECPSCGSRYILGGPASARGGYNSNTWVYNMLIHNPAGRIEPPDIVPSPGWKVNDVGANYYPQ